jgi:hypothetical protein
MARPLRIHIRGALYHVMSRGNACQEIFLDADDYAYFLERLCGSDAFLARVEPALEPRRGEREVVYGERYACRPSLAHLLTDAWDPDALDIAMWEAFERHGYTLREVGEFLGRPPATVWRRVRHGARSAADVVVAKNEKREI